METIEQPILSVTEISLSLKSCVEQVFGHIRVRGEIIGVKKAPSGHTYFSLKDNDSVLSAICWRGRDTATMNALQDGLEVICSGKLSTYPGRSSYQMIVEKAEPAGIGALLKLLNERRIKLEKEGLFALERKKSIPMLPNVIGVVTSPSGAVIRDIMHRLNDRFPRHVLLWPVLVQGEGAAEQITNAINGFNQIPPEGIQTPTGFIPRPDVLIVARGGGSFEDLFCFNEENVVRAAAASAIPLISAVGHETDTTLIDYAADLRAPTPTGAAEKAVPVRAEISVHLQNLQARLTDGLFRVFKDNQLRLESLSRGMPRLSDVINTFFERLDDRSERLKNSVFFYIKNIENQANTLFKLLNSYSYNAVLERGFSLITGNDGHILTSAGVASREKMISVCFADGQMQATPIQNSFQPKNASDDAGTLATHKTATEEITKEKNTVASATTQADALNTSPQSDNVSKTSHALDCSVSGTAEKSTIAEKSPVQVNEANADNQDIILQPCITLSTSDNRTALSESALSDSAPSNTELTETADIPAQNQSSELSTHQPNATLINPQPCTHTPKQAVSHQTETPSPSTMQSPTRTKHTAEKAEQLSLFGVLND